MFIAFLAGVVYAVIKDFPNVDNTDNSMRLHDDEMSTTSWTRVIVEGLFTGFSVSFLCIAIYNFGLITLYLLLPIVGIFIAVAFLINIKLFKEYVPSYSVRFAILNILIGFPILAYVYGLSAANEIKHVDHGYKYIDSSQFGSNLRIIGTAGNNIFFYDHENSRVTYFPISTLIGQYVSTKQDTNSSSRYLISPQSISDQVALANSCIDTKITTTSPGNSNTADSNSAFYIEIYQAQRNTCLVSGNTEYELFIPNSLLGDINRARGIQSISSTSTLTNVFGRLSSKLFIPISLNKTNSTITLVVLGHISKSISLNIITNSHFKSILITALFLVLLTNIIFAILSTARARTHLNDGNIVIKRSGSYLISFLGVIILLMALGENLLVIQKTIGIWPILLAPSLLQIVAEVLATPFKDYKERGKSRS